MKTKYVDVTSLLVGARNNETVALQQLAKKFAQGRFLVPLATTKDVRNTPEFVEEKGEDVPAHYLSLADGRRGAVFFTNRSSARLAEKELSWETDNRSLKCLSIPGTVMASHAEVLFDDGAIDRVILNPAGPHETHLSQSDLAVLVKGQPPSALSFHAGQIPVPSFLPPSLVDSLKDVALSKADSFLKQIADKLENLSNQPTLQGQSSLSTMSSQSSWSSTSNQPLVIGGGNEQVDAVVSQLFAIFSKLPPDDSAPGLFVSVNKTGDDVQIEVNRSVPDDLLNEAHQAVKQTLSGAGSFQLNLDLSMTQMLSGNGFGAPAWSPPVPTKTTTKMAAPKQETAPATSAARPSSEKRRSRTLNYIPLDPESSDDSGKS